MYVSIDTDMHLLMSSLAWLKVSPTTMNGNEQSHRNVNRDGVGLTLLASVMRGMQYDKRAYHGIEGLTTTGVHMRDEIATHHIQKRRTIDCQSTCLL